MKRKPDNWQFLAPPTTDTTSLPIYAVGDIHAQPKLLKTAIDKIYSRISSFQEHTAATIILLGDLIDRGPAVQETIDIAINIQENTPHRLVFILGNHEDCFEKFIYRRLEQGFEEEWFDNFGGRETINALGITASILAAPNRYEHIQQNYAALKLLELISLGVDHFKLEQLFFSHYPNKVEEKMSQDGKLTWGIHGHQISDNLFTNEHIINLDRGSYINNTVGILAIEKSGLFYSTANTYN